MKNLPLDAMAEKQHDIPALLKDVQLILRDLLKVIKVVWMYPPDNPLPQSMRQSFAEGFVNLVRRYGGLSLIVQKRRILCDDEVVFEDSGREEALAAIFFNAGITQLQFLPNLNWENIFTLLEVIKKHQNQEMEATDLASALWEANITGFRLQTVEDVELGEYDPDFEIQEFLGPAESDLSPGMSEIPDQGLYQSIFEPPDDLEEAEGGALTLCHNELSDSGSLSQPEGFDASGSLSIFFDDGDSQQQAEVATASKAMGFDDLVQSSSPLDPKQLLTGESRLAAEEKKEAETLLEADAAFDAYESTLELLKEMIHQEADLPGLNETATIIEKHLTLFLRAGRFGNAADLLTYVELLVQQVRKERPLWAERLKQIRVTTASRERMHELAFALNEYAHVTGSQLEQLLHLLGNEALANAADLLPSLLHEHHTNALVTFLAERGRKNVPIIARGLHDKRIHVIRNAVIVLARVGTDEALGHLEKVADNPEREIRLELVTSLADSPSEKALGLLLRLGYDLEEDVRRAALNSIVQRRGTAAFNAIADLIGDDRFETLAPEDQQSLLTAYSSMGGEHSLNYLGALIRRRNILRDSRISFLREAALQALVFNRSDAAEKLLVKLASSWSPDLKRRAADVLKRRRDQIYGGERD